MHARDPIAFVLVRPQHPGNVGAAARVMANFGLGALELVAPEHDPLDDPLGEDGLPRGQAWAMACGATELLAGAGRHASLSDAVADAEIVVATSRRLGDDRVATLDPVEAARLVVETSRRSRSVVLFGPEATGLTNEDLRVATHVVTVPTSERLPSINLAQAVAIMAYEIGRHRPPDDPIPVSLPTANRPSTAAEREGMLEHLRGLLERVGFLNPQNPDDVMRSLRRLFNRARLDDRDVRILRGICRQCHWGLDHPEERPGEPSADVGREPSADVGREPSADLGHEPSADLGHEPSADLGCEPSADLGHEPSGPPVRRSSVDSDKE